MSWLQVELQATPGSLSEAEAALNAAGAVAITLLSDADEPVLEPAPETRESGWIMTALAEKMGVIPEIPAALMQAARDDREGHRR